MHQLIFLKVLHFQHDLCEGTYQLFEVLKFQSAPHQNQKEIRENGGHTKLKLTSEVHDSEGKIR